NLAVFHRTSQCAQWGSQFCRQVRARPFAAPQTRGSGPAGALLSVLALLAHNRLQGIVAPLAVPRFYQDLRSSEFTAQFAIFHQRYSTNTEPSWQLAQPFRYVAHNGEINTVISNRRWLRARE